MVEDVNDAVKDEIQAEVKKRRAISPEAFARAEKDEFNDD
jgi:hypothetical protein